ncbi:MAG: deoxyribodipyrimidine photo-lyase, partial [Candidatus Omnitrophica bacterium]|nr:deoxyribodipyrimidine photo-lyase [Candidatus Omnitrophota bacterium]
MKDHPALLSAAERGSPVIPVFIWQPDREGDWNLGAAGRWWLHHSLIALDRDLKKLGSRLLIRKGDSIQVLQDLIVETHADALFWNRRYEPALVALNADVKSEFRSQGVDVKSFNGSLLYEPWEIMNKQGKPFRVFTAFWKACLALPEPPSPLPAPQKIPAPSRWPRSLPVDDLELLPIIDWAGGLRDAWRPGVQGAEDRLDCFIDRALPQYSEARDWPSVAGTSFLSPHLCFGEISSRHVMHAVLAQTDSADKTVARNAWSYVRQLGWREFSYHLLFHFPFTSESPLNGRFAHFAWKNNPRHLSAWRKGKTGYPIVDAGMRELWHTGWMHNRVRMTVASFLVKDLLIPWQEGARWFWDTLADADLANNTMGWQWTAGCGADAAPY